MCQTTRHPSTLMDYSGPASRENLNTPTVCQSVSQRQTRATSAGCLDVAGEGRLLTASLAAFDGSLRRQDVHPLRALSLSRCLPPPCVRVGRRRSLGRSAVGVRPQRQGRSRRRDGRHTAVEFTTDGGLTFCRIVRKRSLPSSCH